MAEQLTGESWEGLVARKQADANAGNEAVLTLKADSNTPAGTASNSQSWQWGHRGERLCRPGRHDNASNGTRLRNSGER